jgi:hypothetical protein
VNKTIQDGRRGLLYSRQHGQRGAVSVGVAADPAEDAFVILQQDVEGSAAKGQCHTLAPQHRLAARKLKRVQLQISMNTLSHAFIMDLVCFSGLLNHRRKNPSAFLIDICCFGSLRAALPKGISTRRPAYGLPAASDACRFPLAIRDRTLSPLFVSPEWGEDRRG